MIALKYFMWGCQHLYHNEIESSAIHLFRSIDSNLVPNVFLVGILSEEMDNRHRICLEPEFCGYKVESFGDVKALSNELTAVDQENRIHHTSARFQEQHEKNISVNALRSAIEKNLENQQPYSDNRRFISHPSYINGYLVFIVLELPHKPFEQHPSIHKAVWHDRYRKSTCFINSAVEMYFGACADALKEPGRPNFYLKRTDELLRDAGRDFTRSVAISVNSIDGMYGLFEDCNNISSLRYEGEEGFGKMLVAEDGHENIKMTFRLNLPINLDSFRTVRKFLELSNGDSMIVSNGSHILGLGTYVGSYNAKSESLFVINFIGHYKWEIVHNSQTLMVTQYGLPNIKNDSIRRKDFVTALGRSFGNFSKDQGARLWEVASQATTQKHGTMIVISDHAAEEAARIANQSFGLQPVRLDGPLVSDVTSIDGAVLVDLDATCYAIGVILDGVSTDKGDPSRGARFNSAIRYYENLKELHKILIVIVSEDGMINLVPQFRSGISKSKLEQSINKFRSFMNSDEVSRREFAKSSRYFDSVSFYLTEEQCKEINALRVSIQEKLDDGLIVEYKELKSSPDMKESYYE
jgi:hypothetical protein